MRNVGFRDLVRVVTGGGVLPSTRLEYSVTPERAPVGSSTTLRPTVELMITVSNRTVETVPISQILFSLIDGGLTETPALVMAAPTLGVPWEIRADDLGSFSAAPNAPGGGIAPGRSIAFVLSGIGVAPGAEPGRIFVWEQSDVIASRTLEVPKVSGSLAITALTAGPVDLEAGQQTLLTWQSIGARRAALILGGSRVDVPVSGVKTIALNATTNVVLEVSDGELTTYARTTILVRPGGAACAAEPPRAPVRSPAPRSAPPALLSYSVTPMVVPTGGLVTLLVAVTNATDEKIDLSSLIFSIPSGAEAGALTNDPSAISPSAAVGTPWSIRNDAGLLTAVPDASGELPPESSIAFLLSGISVARTIGLSVIDVTEVSDALRTTRLGVTKVDAGLAITSFTANPIQVAPGEPVTLAWTTTGASSTTLSGDGIDEPVPVNGQTIVCPTTTTTYTLTAQGNAPPTSEQVTVTVPELEILDFRVEPAAILPNQPAVLRWRVRNARTAYLEPGHDPLDPVEGFKEVTTDVTKTYILIVEGPGGTRSATAVLNVLPVAIDTYSATPELIPLGGSAELSWSVRNAVSVRIEPDVGPVPLSGKTNVQPQVTTIYRLIADGAPAPVERSATVTLGVGILSFVASKPVPFLNNLTVLSWKTQNATSTEIRPDVGAVAPEGAATVFPSHTTTYQLLATGPGGLTTREVTVEIPEVTITAFELNGIFASEGAFAVAVVRWATANATAVKLFVTGDIEPERQFNLQTSGELWVDVSKDQNYDFVLEADGPGGPARQMFQWAVR